MKLGPYPTLTDQDKALAQRLHAGGRSIAGLAREFEVSHMTMRRAIDPDRYQVPKKPEPEGKRYKFREYSMDIRDRRDPQVRVSDEPDHPMARLINEGPSPQRRQLMAEGRI